MGLIISIDPGITGAVAVLSDLTRDLIKVVDTPTQKVKRNGKNKTVYDTNAMAALLRPYAKMSNVRGVCEAVHSMPAQGVSSSFNFGMGYGLWLGIMAGLDISYTTVTPQAWKKHFDLIGQEKKASAEKAAKVFPGKDWYTPRGRALDGMADAALIAKYWVDYEDRHVHRAP